jgi:competence protein ComEC
MRWLVAIAAAWLGAVLCPPGATLALVGAAIAVATWARRGLAVAALVAAAWAGGAAARAAREPAPALPAGELWQGTVALPVEEVPGARHVVVDVGGLRVLVTEAQPAPGTGTPLPALLPGDRVRFAGALGAPLGFDDEGAFDRARWLRGRGIDAVAAARPPGVIPLAAAADGREAPRGLLARGWRAAAAVRDRAARVLLASSRGDGGALLQALVLGRRGQVPPRVEEAFRRAGVSHVLSVSGLHLAAVALLLYALVRRAWARLGLAHRVVPDRAAALVAAPAALAYTMITGAEVATVRSLICVLALLGAKLAGRRPDALTALALAALLVLLAEPLAAWDVSFQLSFTATWALAAAAERQRQRRADTGGGGWLAGRTRFVRWIGQTLLASLVAFLATAPLTALHFGVIQPAGLVANVAVVPLAELVILPLGLAGAALGALWPAAGAPLVTLAGWTAGALSWLVAAIARAAPVVSLPPPSSFELLALGAALVALATLVPWRRALLVAGSLAAVAAGSCVVGTCVAPALRREVRVTFLDVGQGSAAVIEAPGGETWLIDAGGRLFGAPGPEASEDERLAATAGDPGEQAVWRFLAARRVRRLDLVVVSHPHPDHFGGLEAVARHLPIAELWYGGEDGGDRRFAILLASLRARGTRVLAVPAGSVHARGGARLEALAPAAADPLRSVNDGSLVVRLGVGGRAVLFPGDLEAAGEAELVASVLPDKLHADVIAVPHHGSRTSSSPALVAAVAPQLAVVSLGAGNRFGFPAAEVIERWRGAGARVLRTDRAGAITVELDGAGGLRVATRR